MFQGKHIQPQQTLFERTYLTHSLLSVCEEYFMDL